LRKQKTPSTLHANEDDKRIANGSCAICIIDSEGMIYGKLYGNNVIRAREAYRVAWTKQARFISPDTKRVNSKSWHSIKKIDEKSFGIERPDYIGRVGGQPLVLKNGTKLSVGFSGFRGIIDLEIVNKAIEKLGV
jgi:glc operon protein GlcG